jgi:hypothetical protein
MIDGSNHAIDFFVCLFLCTHYVHKKEVRPEVVDTIVSLISVGHEPSVCHVAFIWSLANTTPLLVQKTIEAATTFLLSWNGLALVMTINRTKAVFAIFSLYQNHKLC